jgi:AcrR family transcriptional regulator
MVRTGTDLKQRIAQAAAEILFHHGSKRLSQLEVAKVLGIRQSHLTYYYPRRADLLAAVADRFLSHASEEFAALSTAGAPPATFVAELGRRMTVPGALRAFFGLLIEADEDEALRKSLAAHLEQFSVLVATELGHAATDPDVRLFVAALRGLAPTCFLAREPASSDLALSIARRLELLPAAAPKRASLPRATSKPRRVLKSRAKRP